MANITLKIEGMSCAGCVATVKRVLEAKPGVTRVTVSLDPACAAIDFDPARVSTQELTSAVEAAGYDVVV